MAGTDSLDVKDIVRRLLHGNCLIYVCIYIIYRQIMEHTVFTA
jgi:hypothetical protein